MTALKDDYDILLNCLTSVKYQLKKSLFKGKSWIFTTESSLLRDVSFLEKKESYDSQYKNNEKNVKTLKPLSTFSLEKKADEIQKDIKFNKKHTFSEDSNVLNTQCKIIFVRLCPSEDELINAKPYSDSAGENIRTIMQHIKWKDEEIYKTYLYHYPMDFIANDNNALVSWKKNFFEDIKSINAKIIICWGERVSQILAGSDKNIDELFNKSQKDHLGRHFFFFWEPQYFMKKQNLKKLVWKKIQAINNFLQS